VINQNVEHYIIVHKLLGMDHAYNGQTLYRWIIL